MSSKEIAKERKGLEKTFQKEANVLTGEYSNAKVVFDDKMKELQKKCLHVWDNGEYAIQKLDTHSVCAICRKKIDI